MSESHEPSDAAVAAFLAASRIARDRDGAIRAGLRAAYAVDAATAPLGERDMTIHARDAFAKHLEGWPNEYGGTLVDYIWDYIAKTYKDGWAYARQMDKLRMEAESKRLCPCHGQEWKTCPDEWSPA